MLGSCLCQVRNCFTAALLAPAGSTMTFIAGEAFRALEPPFCRGCRGPRCARNCDTALLIATAQQLSRPSSSIASPARASEPEALSSSRRT